MSISLQTELRRLKILFKFHEVTVVINNNKKLNIANLLDILRYLSKNGGKLDEYHLLLTINILYLQIVGTPLPLTICIYI